MFGNVEDVLFGLLYFIMIFIIEVLVMPDLLLLFFVHVVVMLILLVDEGFLQSFNLSLIALFLLHNLPQAFVLVLQLL